MDYYNIFNVEDFIRMNPYWGPELVYFLSTLVFQFSLFFLFRNRRFKKKSRLINDNYFFSFIKVSSGIFVILVLRLHIVLLFEKMQVDTFLAADMMSALYDAILRLGTLLHEIIVLLIVYLIFKSILHFRSPKKE